jgi:hypothetical protein
MDDRIIIDTDDYAVYLTEDHRYRRICNDRPNEFGQDFTAP